MKKRATGYSGNRHERGTEVWRLNGNGGDLLLPGPSQKIWNHSPNGFNWGYAGSGPSQLALAILLDFTGDPQIAQRFYQEFKSDVVANLADAWNLPAEQIESWLESKGVKIGG